MVDYQMNQHLNLIIIFSLFACVIACENESTEPDDDSRPIDTTKVIDDLCFERDVLPIFQSSCALSGCHDAATASHEVVMDSWESVMMGSKDIVTPFDPRDSELYEKLVEEEGALNEDCGIVSECDIKDVLWPSVQIILQDNCLGCHANDIAIGDIRLEDPADVQEQITNGTLIPSIRRESGVNAMPPFSILDSCSVEVITAWRDQGFRR
jgi:hypothetical protein